MVVGTCKEDPVAVHASEQLLVSQVFHINNGCVGRAIIAYRVQKDLVLLYPDKAFRMLAYECCQGRSAATCHVIYLLHKMRLGLRRVSCHLCGEALTVSTL